MISPPAERAARTQHALCVYGPQHVDCINRILIPALAAQVLPAGDSLVLHLLNYRNNEALLAGRTQRNLEVRDESASRQARHIGFGEAVNYLFGLSAPEDGFFLINPDSYPFAGCLATLLATKESAMRAGIVEARQWPFEHPKEYDTVTLETPWASGAFSWISAAAFRAVGGFDPVYFLYNEDVDISWRIRLAGYHILYSYDALAAHFTGLLTYRADRYYYEHFFSSRNFIALSYKFFGSAGEARAIALLGATTLPAAFQERVLASYREMKPAIATCRETVNSPLCKITGFNLYHECRWH